MRIGFDAKRLFNNFTGLGNYSRFVVKALIDHFPTHSYTLYTPKLKKHPNTKDFREDSRLMTRTPPRWVKGSGFGSFWRSVNLGNIAFRDGMDLFHGLSNELPVTKPPGLKTIVTIHDLIFVRYPELYSAIDVRIYKNKLKRACASADKIIAISQQTASDLEHYVSVPKDRIKVIYQGCDNIFKERYTKEMVDSVSNTYSLPRKYILSVGTLEPRKNVLQLLQALTKVDVGVSLVLVGKSTAYQKTLNEFITKNKLNDRVYFIHKVDFNDLPKIYQGASVFVYPSRFEGFGIPIVEAIQSRIPVVAATGSCLEEAGGPASCYVGPDDDEGLASAINEILSNESRKNQMVEDSLNYVQRFEPKIIATDINNLYGEVMS